MKEFLTVGQIINTHGIKGEVKVYPLTDNTNRFRKIKKVYIDDEERNVLWCKIQPDKIIMKIEGIETPEVAFKYKNKYLKVSRKDAVALEKGSYFVADIIGCTVIDEEEKIIGTVHDVIFTGSNDVYWVKGNEDDVMIPALKSIVVNMDMSNKRIVIKPVRTWS
ncbi:ribosome maturation factor RimM [Clostridium pasteurianum DSM 525 = ATCC 6013]|uniref:Ribosome maturation factor RimM n=1 Tax=Clostridium pasteurianum DSM 525 = ATCC 6013 TaxID=1262449 RepID=A0A0H3J8B0_CLOPA|nr:ribosome maturation factor RimM [Clostridium pasteurianum]AJA48138.1 ribosome maturation factor RimM [Clostridium pasteurianum DSM 525 = ATCC 6013]AJA52126.1 ribosome maturation factor RimM [Clostridium pasteurianum DSM 525 = ATCC 6013]AOZ75402.1 16S rRNA processing protein RimM [Clostridium pasteurianum DSM 525 = ATCC 6013]AOZ79197.1 16S rRNA processing protein RimM [Clostridium pasteurianum]ELP60709.1 16S rRNA-processing protein RimM [Clostridium pasteurianum DSM 525 = ATCC 6013]